MLSVLRREERLREEFERGFVVWMVRGFGKELGVWMGERFEKGCEG